MRTFEPQEQLAGSVANVSTVLIAPQMLQVNEVTIPYFVMDHDCPLFAERPPPLTCSKSSRSRKTDSAFRRDVGLQDFADGMEDIGDLLVMRQELALQIVQLSCEVFVRREKMAELDESPHN